MDRQDVILYKDVVIVRLEDTVVDVSFRVPMDSTDGIAHSLVPVRMGLIVMEPMGGVCVQQVFRATNVNKSVQKDHLGQHAVNSVIVESTNAMRQMENAYVQLEDTDLFVKRSVDLEDMDSLVRINVNVLMEPRVMLELANAVAPRDGSAQRVKLK